MTAPDDRRHTVSRLIEAAPDKIYEAFLSREAMATWLPPAGATGAIDEFEPYRGGRFRLTLRFASSPGKSSDDTDVVAGRFVALVPGRRLVLSVEFVSPDPAFSGTMTMEWRLDAAPGGTLVTVTADDVPAGIGRAEHEAGMGSTLANLAAYVE